MIRTYWELVLAHVQRELGIDLQDVILIALFGYIVLWFLERSARILLWIWVTLCVVCTVVGGSYLLLPLDQKGRLTSSTLSPKSAWEAAWSLLGRG